LFHSGHAYALERTHSREFLPVLIGFAGSFPKGHNVALTCL
jgi:hypothetical protein